VFYLSGNRLKILLLNPPLNFGVYNEGGRVYYDRSYPPLGLAYIAAMLEKEGYDVNFFDLMESSFEDAERIIKKEKPQIVGISCNLSDYRWGAFRVAQIAKKINAKIKVVMGGCHATNLFEQILGNFPVDIVVRFEGELTFLELVRSLEKDSGLKKVLGIAFKDGKAIIKNEDRTPVENLDNLPFPAHHFFDFNLYTNYPSELSFKGKKVSEMKSINIITSRGCPHDCHYCSITAFWRRKFRVRGVKNVVDEMQMLYEKFGVEYFDFFDSVFSLNKERVIDLCKEILSRKLDVCWGCVTRVDLVSRDMLEWMAKAGCLRISYGVESGSPLVLKSVNKKQTRAQIVDAFKITHETGISAYILLMIGNPNETKHTIEETIDIIKEVKPDKIRTNLTIIYPGTKLYELGKKTKLIDNDYWLSRNAAPVYTAENNIQQLKRWEDKIRFAYYLERKKFLRLGQIIIYRRLFLNFREMAKVLGSRFDGIMEKVDHIIHQA